MSVYFSVFIPAHTYRAFNLNLVSYLSTNLLYTCVYVQYIMHALNLYFKYSRICVLSPYHTQIKTPD